MKEELYLFLLVIVLVILFYSRRWIKIYYLNDYRYLEKVVINQTKSRFSFLLSSQQDDYTSKDNAKKVVDRIVEIVKVPKLSLTKEVTNPYDIRLKAQVKNRYCYKLEYEHKTILELLVEPSSLYKLHLIYNMGIYESERLREESIYISEKVREITSAASAAGLAQLINEYKNEPEFIKLIREYYPFLLEPGK